MTEDASHQGQDFELEPLGEAPPRSTGPRMLIPLFLVPLFIVAVVVAIFLGVSALVGGESSPSDLIERVETGGYNDRWQAAASLADLAVREPEALDHPDLRARIRRAFELAGPSNPALRQYLARVMGTLKDRRAAPLLMTAIQQHLDFRATHGEFAGDDPEESGREFMDLVLNLGQLGDPTPTSLLLSLAGDSDPGIRQVVALALGDLHLHTPPGAVPDEVASALVRLHADEEPWVRMNAALSLAKIGREEGAPTLEYMLNRENLKTHGLVFPDQGGYSVASHDPAFRPIAYSLVSLHRLAELSPSFGRSDPALKASLERLASEDPNQRLRQGAKELLEVLSEPSAN